MTSSILESLVWRLLGALITLVVCVLSMPSVARAGCERGTLALEGVAHFDRLVAAGALATATTATPIDHTQPPSPCPGGLCSRGPVEEPSPPAPSISGQMTQWLFLTRRADLPNAGSAILPRNEDDLGPIHQGQSLFRPPRPA